jgi:hypothetical protein
MLASRYATWHVTLSKTTKIEFINNSIPRTNSNEITTTASRSSKLSFSLSKRHKSPSEQSELRGI